MTWVCLSQRSEGLVVQQGKNIRVKRKTWRIKRSKWKQTATIERAGWLRKADKGLVTSRETGQLGSSRKESLLAACGSDSQRPLETLEKLKELKKCSEEESGQGCLVITGLCIEWREHLSYQTYSHCYFILQMGETKIWGSMGA